VHKLIYEMRAFSAIIIVFYVGVLSAVGCADVGIVRGRRELADSAEARCSVVNERSETIIQTKQSLGAGAEFLVSPDIGSQDDCLSACCNTPSCNTAIVKLKVRLLAKCMKNDETSHTAAVWLAWKLATRRPCA